MSEKSELERAIDEIRVSDAVVVLGAGTSFEAGMPLSGQLAPLVWHTLDAHTEVRQRVASALLTVDAPAKRLVGDNPPALKIAFDELGSDRPARRTFQKAFCGLDRDRSSHISTAHDALARLVHAGRVIRVVSLNWDTLLETAFRRRYGADINGQEPILWKPHGDCQASTDWVLPNQESRIPDQLVTGLRSLVKQRPRVLLIVGYSERDEEILQRVVTPLAARWRVFRLDVNAVGEGAIRMSATEGVAAIADALVPSPELPGWAFVSFDSQRGIEAAVSGERLGPRDVDVCPRLPHYEYALKAAQTLYYVDIAGPSGCGKSITAWQVARRFNQEGWHVLRPELQGSLADGVALASLRTGRWKRVVVVDDTQTIHPTLIERLHELAEPRLTVVTGTTDASGEQPRSVRIPAGLAVEAIANAFRTRRNEILPILSTLDPRIGDQYMATPLESRIDEAAKATTPWEFTFIARGGWARAREQLAALRDFDRADQLLSLIAARQLLSLDGGADVSVIVEDANALGRSKEWVITGIELLRRQNAILPAERLRCLHIQSAVVVIEASLKRRNEGFTALVGALRRMVYDSRAPIRGISWLTERILGSDAFRYSSLVEDKFLEPEPLEQLTKRLLASADPISRRDSAFLMSRLLWYGGLPPERVVDSADTVRAWLETATAEDCYALGDLVNMLAYRKASMGMVGSIDPCVIWRRIETLDSVSGYAFGHFLGRLANGGGHAWRVAFVAAIDQDRALSLIDRFSLADLDGVSELVCALASFDLMWGIESVRRAMPLLQAAMARDALDAYTSAIREIDRRILGNPLFTRPRRTTAQKTLAKHIADGIDPIAFAAGVHNCRYGDWETYAGLLDFVRRSHPRKHREIVAAIDWETLERRTANFWARPPRELRLLLSYLAVPGTNEPVRSWVFQHRDRIREIDPILTRLSPKTAIAILKNGGRVNLGGHNGSDWALQMVALAEVARLDRGAASEILRANRDHIIGRLSNLEGIDCEELPLFLELMAELDRPLLKEMLRTIDLASATEKWQHVGRNQRPEVRKGAALVFRIISANSQTPIKDLAKSALKRLAIRPKQLRSRS